MKIILKGTALTCVGIKCFFAYELDFTKFPNLKTLLISL